MDAEKTEQPVVGGMEIAWLKGRVKELQERVATLERDSHAPVDLRPAVTALVTELVGAAAVESRDARIERGTLGCRQITVSAEESDSIRYALCEAANRRAEQAIDYGQPLRAEEANNLRALAWRIAKESKRPNDKLSDCP